MPFTIRRVNGKECVFKKENGKPVGKSLGCHDSRSGAIAQIAAIEASESERSIPIKQGKYTSMQVVITDSSTTATETVGLTDNTTSSVTYPAKENYIEDTVDRDNSPGNVIKEIGENRLGFYGYLWGTPSKKDLHREYFSKETEGLTELFDQLGAVPFTYAHARDKLAKATVFGLVDTMKEDDIGMWVEVQITNHRRYREMLKPIIEEEALYPSSETLVGAKRVAKDGHIQRWVTSFMTATTTPAEWRMIDHPMEEIKSLYKSIGVDEDKFEDAVGIDVESDDEATDINDNTETQKEEVNNQGAAEARLKALIEIEFQKLQLLQLNL